MPYASRSVPPYAILKFKLFSGTAVGTAAYVPRGAAVPRRTRGGRPHATSLESLENRPPQLHVPS
eukprot:SAG31_NODE_20248_length_580_cov_0.721414_1_plen_64_part_10